MMKIQNVQTSLRRKNKMLLSFLFFLICLSCKERKEEYTGLKKLEFDEIELKEVVFDKFIVDSIYNCFIDFNTKFYKENPIVEHKKVNIFYVVIDKDKYNDTIITIYPSLYVYNDYKKINCNQFNHQGISELNNYKIIFASDFIPNFIKVKSNTVKIKSLKASNINCSDSSLDIIDDFNFFPHEKILRYKNGILETLFDYDGRGRVSD